MSLWENEINYPHFVSEADKQASKAFRDALAQLPRDDSRGMNIAAFVRAIEAAKEIARENEFHSTKVNEPNQEQDPMSKTRNSATLLMEGVKTVGVVFEPSLTVEEAIQYKNTRKVYTYKTVHEHEVGEQIIVMGQGRTPQIVTVVDVHDEVKIDLDATFSYAWIVGPITTEPCKKAYEIETEISETIDVARKAALRAAFQQEMLENLSEEAQASIKEKSKALGQIIDVES